MRFVLSTEHKDYQRYFKHVFTDMLPMCDDIQDKEKLFPINPHVFFQTHVHNSNREEILRPLFNHILSDLFWDNLRAEVKEKIAQNSPQWIRTWDFSAIHVRRGDKCIEEAECPKFDHYYNYLQGSEHTQHIFLMTDAYSSVKTEIDVTSQFYFIASKCKTFSAIVLSIKASGKN